VHANWLPFVVLDIVFSIYS